MSARLSVSCHKGGNPLRFVSPPSHEDILSLETSFGKVDGFQMRSNHYLVWKLDTSEHSEGRNGHSIVLPQRFRRRARRNIVSLFGYVVKASSPFRTAVLKRKFTDLEGKPRHVFSTGPISGPFVEERDCILYNSYNVGAIAVEGGTLVIVRGVDIEASFPITSLDAISIGDHALSVHYGI
jgi:hypothetical protein